MLTGGGALPGKLSVSCTSRCRDDLKTGLKPLKIASTEPVAGLALQQISLVMRTRRGRKTE